MRNGMTRLVTLLVVVGLTAGAAHAHFHILLPQFPAVKRGEAVAFSYSWGHPFEHQFFDAELPRTWVIQGPDGSRTDLLASSKKESGPDQRTGFRATFTPSLRGDYACVLECPPVWMEEDGEFLQDTVKVILHVQAQKGWDVNTGQGFDLVPLTRPYGLQAGTVFQARAFVDGKPLADRLVEIERYNATAPKALPPDELITRTAKTDPNGVVTTTLSEPGWWCVTASCPGGTRGHKGKTYPVRRRATLWVYAEAREPTQRK